MISVCRHDLLGDTTVDFLLEHYSTEFGGDKGGVSLLSEAKLLTNCHHLLNSY
jgi:hypothetical protein